MNDLFAQKLCELLAGLMVLALGLYIVLEAQGFPTLPGNDYGAALFPKLIGYGMAAGGGWLTLTSLRPFFLALTKRTRQPLSQVMLFLFRLALPVLLVIAYLLLADTLGTVLILGLITAALMFFSGVRLWLAIVLGALTTSVIWFAFVYMLKVPLPFGVLFG